MTSVEMTTYGIEVFHIDRPDDFAILKRAVAAELHQLGLHRSVSIAVAESVPGDDAPAVGVWLGSAQAKESAGLVSRAAQFLAAGGVVLPVVADLDQFTAGVPPELATLNGFKWSTSTDLESLVHVILEELGIEEQQRRVFISHKRDDGLGAAEQVHDRLTHHRFLPFIDRFAIPNGERVQEKIADALEDHAFLLLLETPDAHTSDWVFDELEYALSHGMGVLILSWPNVSTEVAGSAGIPRIRLTDDDIEQDTHGFEVLNSSALDRLVGTVEATHAATLCRRRRYLITSIQEAATAAGAVSCVPLRNWRILITYEQKITVVGTTPRLPSAFDLQGLAQATSDDLNASQSILVYSARSLRAKLREHLAWVVGDRDVTILPENAIGGHW